MACFLTTARLALLGKLQADATLNADIKTWFTWGPGIRRKHDLTPAVCPALSVAPAELDVDQSSNMAAGYPQDLEVGIATLGQDAAPCEELVAAAVDVVAAANRSSLDALAGVTGVEIRSARWMAVEDEPKGRVRWEAQLVVRIQHMRRTA